VLCLVQDGYAYWAHVGDSRLYHFRKNKLLTRTLDHTATERLRTDGVITEEEMLSHPEKSRLLKCVGGPQKPTISLGQEAPLHRGDALLLCSDGLWEALSWEEIVQFLEFESLDEAIEEMTIEAENRRKKASDNISVVSLRWQDRAPKDRPVQANEVVHVDQDALWEMAKNKMLVKKARTKTTRAHNPRHRTRKQAPRKTRKKELRSEIKELEDYIKRIE
jgi:hypothetical protein